MKYNVQMLVTGTITKVIAANSPKEAKEIASERYGDKSITLCSHCSNVVEGLTISEYPGMYEIEEIN